MKENKAKFGINYIETNSTVHQLNGITKFILFVAWITVVLLTFDLRIILLMIAIGIGLLKLSKIPFATYKPLLIGTISVLLINACFMFALSPQQGTEYLKSTTVLIDFNSRYSITQETLFYLLTVTLKYFSMFPMALVFVFTTHPTQFAASLNRLGLPYKIAYAISLTLRYLPEVKSDFINIMHAQQARGIELGKKAPFIKRMKNVANILGPLVFSSLDRAEHISNAMVLRGFGRNKSRSWYNYKAINNKDILVIALISLILMASISKRILDAELFWYPF